MPATTHKVDATISCGDPDIGAEVDLRITFKYQAGAPEQGPTYASGGQPADPDEIEFVSCVQIVNGKESPTYGAFRDLEQQSLDAIAEAWLQGDEGQAQATEQAMDDWAARADEAEEARAESRRAY
ncbi:hypothetical protein [Reyranella sp.]|jgi:hypothetical protein|uniref:hypothetical protein n=1 Tax=Reyranella sp. TaxID=1929291 RepID=UPI000BDC71AF|nr:hypothetical protein [Reyranella sp.]OYY35593.1 MAG: hypothetical protein B7Y57_25780 [Rhodospirillales bacterium 35-66-84]OYZ91463.1 MAG: hypothetical protein B7Y08_25650 [Rhodospirillales bacterium 24-66-33]OZB22000.1 MAG: hypothetical protein B7X63_24575 [Rhodospirillales bacterium 39-66-50]HQS14982.1 hypothetical protein [Reyranella sp.]HQT10791.1 hypothetical protein [Reyranella sp.]